MAGAAWMWNGSWGGQRMESWRDMTDRWIRQVRRVLPVALAAFPLSAAGQADDVAARLRAIETRLDRMERPVGGLADALRIGGYGEMHYNRLDGRGGADDRRELDFHRFVLFVGYDIEESIRFNSEIELEHAVAGDEEPGYLQLEQAYLDFDLGGRKRVRAGLFIVPVGFLNETHEPASFYGVERNRVENRIVPTTWFEGGVGLLGEPATGWQYAAYLHSGLKTDADSKYAIRSGRQKVGHADASDPAGTVSVVWRAPGLTLGGTVHYQSDVTQGQDPAAGEAWLGEARVEARHGPLGLRALYAEWSLEGDGPKAIGADRQYGWYVEAHCRVAPTVGVFGRYGVTDEQAGSSAVRSEKRQWDAGVNWWPVESVVVKADYQWQDNRDGKDQNGFNVGVGYEF